jgi:signal recognition particle subunit SRP68
MARLSPLPLTHAWQRTQAFSSFLPSVCAQPQAQFLLDNLDSWESFAGSGAGAGGARAPPRLLKPPYGFAAIPLRPIMLDTASNSLAYPSLEHRVRKAEKNTLLGSLFSWRR